MKIKKVLSARKALLCAAIASSSLVANASSVSFELVPFDGDVLPSIDVSNDGTVVFASANNGYYQWSASSGLDQLADANSESIDGGFGVPAISADAKYAVFKETGTASDFHVFENGVRVNSQWSVPLSQPNQFLNTGFWSEASFVTGSHGTRPTVYDIATDERIIVGSFNQGQVFKYDAATGNAFIRTGGINDKGTTINYGDGSSAVVPSTAQDDLPVVSDKADSFVRYERFGCEGTNPLMATANCSKIYNTASLQIESEIIGFQPKDVNEDLTMMIGVGGFGSVPGAFGFHISVWDPINGVRHLLPLLEANGIDLTGLDFGDINTTAKTLALSPDGTKIAGTVTAPDGELTPFLIDITPVCTVF